MLRVLVGIILLIVFFIIVGFGVLMVYKKLQITDPSKVDTSTKDTVEIASEFLPFKDINDGVIDLGLHNYRAVIEVGSLNYNLRTEQEQDIVESGFGRFINSIQSPLVLYVQTRKIDNRKIIRDTREDARKAVSKYPAMRSYAESYLMELEQLNETIGNNKQKKKYIIVPYNGALELENMSDAEKKEYSLGELRNKCMYIKDGIEAIGLRAEILDTRGLCSLIYSAYHKDDSSDFENIANGDLLSLIVSGTDNIQRDISPSARMDWILYEAQNRINAEIFNKNLTEEEENEYQKIYANIAYLRNKESGGR